MVDLKGLKFSKMHGIGAKVKSYLKKINLKHADSYATETLELVGMVYYL